MPVSTMLSPQSMCDDVCVLVVADERWGSRLTAYVVTSRPDSELVAAVAAALGPAAVPRAWVHVAGIPELPTGKPDRAALAALNGPHST